MSDININSHSIIEASAGTGKTYTIENLVVKILLETGTKIDEILTVTYTEKATGELKNRIRTKIEKNLKETGQSFENIKKLTEALNFFDSAAIYTIHGFCNRILQEYSFENGLSFRNEVMDDAGIYEKMLKKQIREDWEKIYGNDLEEILLVSGYPDVDNKNGSKWENQVLSLAKKFRNTKNEKIIPEKNPDFKNIFSEIKTKIEKTLLKITEIIGDVDPENISENKFYKKYENLNNYFHSTDVKSRLNQIVSPIVLYIGGYNKSREKYFVKLVELFNDLKKIVSENGFNVLTTLRNKVNSNYLLEFDFPELTELTELFEKVKKELNFEILTNQLKVNTIFKLKEDVKNYKEEKGIISYDDMLLILDEALDRNTELPGILRKKYKFGIVDEFQDTDSIQWNIFRKIFLPDNMTTDEKLFIIGDPKQAIYGFRGADVNTYFEAKDFMEKKCKANIISLDTNYRSTKEMIEVLNILFEEKEWCDLHHKNVKPGGKIKNEKNIKPVTICGMGKIASGDAKYYFANFIGAEIKSLISNGVKASDIAILIRKNNEAKCVEKVLDELTISHSFYKKNGLYQSNEAKNLYYLLNAIAYPENKEAALEALLTEFFDIKIIELDEELLNLEKIRNLFEKWKYFSEKKDYPKLFQSIMIETAIINYCKKESNVRKSTNWERKLTNYEHILQNLQLDAIKNNLDMVGVLERLKNYMSQSEKVEEGTDLERRETEENTVKIMTIHASKGLEFNYVFIAGGFTSKSGSDFYKYHENGITIYDLIKDKSNKDKYLLEEKEENLRLYYVALTRAKYKLYLPYFNHETNQSLGPVGGFLRDSFENSFFENGNIKKGLGYLIDLTETGDSIGYNEYENFQNQFEKEIIDEEPLKIKEIDKSISGRKLTVKSFSSIRKQNLSLEYHFGEKESDENEEIIEETEKELPGGPEIGNMFHKIFEKIDFLKVNSFKTASDLLHDKETNEIILKYFDRFMRQKSFAKETHLAQIAEIIFNTLNTPVSNEGFCLSNIFGDQKLHEVEFYFPFSEIKDLKIEDIEYKNGYFNGFIDMIFKKDEKYYILDWKSNKYPAFSGEDFENQVKHDYELQYKLYTIAVLKWLKTNINDFNFKTHFGGIYYIYIRGKNISDCKNGVFFKTFENDPEEKFENEILKILNKIEE